ncbi:MAG: rhomboid family intramembrane serine protease [Paludibacteraceae bacterium]|nr:rhomboid family intramembrane serine protease [Paludibacteraceae bacterium]
MSYQSSQSSLFPPVVKHLIIINVCMWVSAWVLNRAGVCDLNNLLGMHYWKSEQFNLVQLASYMFMHDLRDFQHILFNMFALWMFGKDIEYALGSKRFLLYYTVCGIGAGLIQQLAWMFDLSQLPVIQQYYLQDLLVTVGASGAVFGLLLAFAILFPQASIYLFFIPIPIRAPYFVAGYAILELFFGIQGSSDGVAHFAHLGGMIFGGLLLFVWKKRNQLY